MVWTLGTLLVAGQLVLSSVQMPGPAPRGPARDAAQLAAQNAGCERCHPAIAAQWRDSYHRRAFTDPAFQEALRGEPLAFCRACHAPDDDSRRDPGSLAGARGVSCVTCHLLGAQVLAAPGRPRAVAPHPIVRSAAFATAAACATCHDFSFPDGQARTRPQFMQTTAQEHARDPDNDRPCQSCHMPAVGGHRSHRFLGGHDAATLRQSLTVRAVRSGPATLRLWLTPIAVGHALPTGDLFRRLAVRAWAVTPNGGEQAPQVRYLTRRFTMERQRSGAPVRVQSSDDRLTGPRVLELDLGPQARGLPLHYRITYQRVLHPGTRHQADGSDDAPLDGTERLAEGMLAP